MLDLFISQVSDVFRIGLLAALVYTTWRTSQATGILLPLIAGVVFVAVIIPTTRAGWSWTDVGVGLISNAVILAVLLVIALIVQKARKPSA